MIPPRYSPERLVIIHTNNPCSSINYYKYLVLYSLLTSHSIRIDTKLVMVSNDTFFILDGYNQKYLHAQDKSLEKYLEKIFCRQREYPGVKIIHGRTYYINTLIDRPDIVFIRSIDKWSRVLTRFNHRSAADVKRILIVDRYPLKNLHISIDESNVIIIDNASLISFINWVHYILDLSIGGWIRRMGVITRVERTREL